MLAPAVAVMAAAGALATPAAAAGGLNLSPSGLEGKVREGKRLPAVTLANNGNRAVVVTAIASPAGQELSGLPRFDLSRRSREAGAQMLRIAPARFRLAPGQSRRVRPIAGPRPRRGIASYAVIAFTVRPHGSRSDGAVVEPQLRLTTNVMLRYSGRARIRGALAGARVEQGPERTLRFLARVRNRGNLHFEPDSRLTVFSTAGKPVVREIFPAENVLPRAARDTRFTLVRKLPRGRYTARVVTRDGRRVSVRRFAFRLVGPNELAATGLKIVSLPTPTPDAGDEFEASVRLENTGNLPFAPRGTLVLRERGGRLVAKRAIAAGRLGPGSQGVVNEGLPALADGKYELSVRFAEGDRVLADRSLVFTTGVAPALIDRILDWIAAHLPLVLGAFGGLLTALALAWIVHTRRLRRRQARVLRAVQSDQEKARLRAEREHEARLAAIEARLMTPSPSPLPRPAGPKPLVIAGVASAVAFLLGGSRARRR